MIARFGTIALSVALAASAPPASPIADSGFESEGAAGRLSAWSDCGAVPATLERSVVKSGRYAVVLAPGAAICQRIVVPLAGSVLLDYWAHVDASEDAAHVPFEVSFYDRIPDGSLSLIQPVVHEATATTTRGFAHYTFDVTELAGQTLVLFFGLKDDRSHDASVVLDDVTFVVERPAENRP